MDQELLPDYDDDITAAKLENILQHARNHLKFTDEMNHALNDNDEI